MELLEKLINAGPLTISLLALLVVLGITYRLFPILVRNAKAKHEPFLPTTQMATSERVEQVAGRAEQISTRVHELSNRIGDVKAMDDRVKTLEVFMDRSRSESGDLRVQIAELAGGMQTQTAKLEDLCERIDRNDEVMGGRIGRLEDKIDGLTDRLLKS